MIPFETKSFDYTPGNQGAFIDFLQSSGNYDLAAYEAARLYAQCPPLFHAIDMRAQEISCMSLQVREVATNEIVPDHPLVPLLNRPNAAELGNFFLYKLSTLLDITGETFLQVNALNPGSEPSEIYAPLPFHVAIPSVAIFQSLEIARTFQTSFIGSPGSSTVYTLDESLAGARQFRYFAQEGMQELIQLKNFNPLNSVNTLRGLSRATPIWVLIQQYIEGSRTNLATLRQGGRPSGMWFNPSDEELTDKQWERLEEERRKYEGARGAGRMFIGDGIEFQPISAANRDMEFSETQSRAEQGISNAYNFPLALLTADARFNNNETGKLSLYDMSVIPHFKNLANFLGYNLFPRFGDDPNKYALTFDESQVPALRSRQLANATGLSGLGAYTRDQIRATLGDDKLDEDGGVIVGVRTNPSLPGNTTGTDQPDVTQDTTTGQASLADYLRGATKHDGSKYTEADIQQRLELLDNSYGTH